MLELKYIFKLIGCIMLLAHRSKAEIIYNGTVNVTSGDSIVLPCLAKLPGETFRTSEMLIYWQQKEAVLMMFRRGKLDTLHQNASYKDRVQVFEDKLETGNFSLKLSPVRRSDGGTYETVIMYNNENKKVECRNVINIGGTFSKPTIHLRACERNPVCESHGGFPEPSVHWTVNNNTVNAEDVDTQSSHEPSNDTFSVRSMLLLSVIGAVTCTIVNPTIPTNRSTTVNVQACTNIVVAPNPTVIASVFLGLALVFIIVLLFCLLFRKSRRRRPSQGHATIVMELETEKLQAKINIDNHISPND